MTPKICAVICAAGKGLRAGFDKNKLLIGIDGECVLQKTVSAFDFSSVDEIVLAVSKDDFSEISALFSDNEKITIVEGGKDRSHSVYNALRATNADVVLIHDGARPFVTRKAIERCIESVLSYGSGICAIPCCDTVAIAKNGKIHSVPDRATLYQIQTPQGFFTKDILQAYEKAFLCEEKTYTDDSSVYAEFIGAPTLCDGDRENVKITYAEDFEERFARCGFGIDTHAFGKKQDFIVLAGVKIPSETGLIAHSDGDVLIHAVMDAMLSGAGLKDIGHYFPDTDEKWKNADSMQMLQAVVELLKTRGFAVKNLSVAIQAERPRLAKFIDPMKQNLAEILNLDLNSVGISAGTNEGLGYVGEGKGITVNAYVLLKKTR